MTYLKLKRYTTLIVCFIGSLIFVPLIANNSNTATFASTEASSPTDDYQTLSTIYQELINRPTCDGLAHTLDWDLSAPMATWDGVTVDPFSGCVTGLVITFKQITGPIPPEIGNLSQLTVLSLSNNCFSGSIPPELGELSQIDDFQLDDNLLTGTIPQALCSLSNVTLLYLDNNNLTGSVPDCFNNLDVLGTLDLFNNCLDTLPDLTGMDALSDYKLVIYNNKFTFDDILPNIDDSWGKHHPQDSVCIESTVVLTTGTNYGIDLGIDADVTSNSYQWYKNGLPLGGPTNINTLSFNPVSFSAAGTYHCRITNPNAPQLTLHSRAKHIEVVCGTSTYFFTPDVCDDYEVEFEGVVFNANFPCGIVDTPEPDQFTCDSIISVCLNFISPPTIEIDTFICASDSIVIDGTSYNFDLPAGTEVLQDQQGCDSLIIEIQVSFFPEAVSNYKETICKNDTTIIHGVPFHFGDSIGQVILPAMSFHNCDSIVNIDIDFWPEATSNYTEFLCPRESLTINGSTYDINFPTGTDTIPNESWRGCDSIVTTTITFFEEATGSYTEILCPGESLTVNGSTYDFDFPTGTDTIPNESWRGCDSIVTTTVTFFEEVIDSINLDVCPGQIIVVNGNSYTCDNPTGTEVIMGGSYTSCDSTVIVTLTCYDPPNGNQQLFACPDGSVIYNGNTYDEDMPTGTENLGSIGFMGCDSLVDVQLDFYLPAFSNIDTLLCPGEVIIVNEVDINESGNYVLTGGSFHECDSTVMVNIDFFPESITVIDDVLCPGSTVTINDIIYDENNLTGRDTLSNFYGCDSIVIIDISYGTAVVVNIDETLCPGDSLIIGDIIYDEDNNTYTDTIPNGSFSGCDSITNINISYFSEAIGQLDRLSGRFRYHSIW